MAFGHGKAGRLLYGAYDLSAYLRDISSPQSLDVAEVSVLTLDDKAYITGQGDGNVTAGGYYDGAAAAIDAIMEAAFTAAKNSGTAVPLTYAPFGHGAVGRRAKLLQALHGSYEISGGIGGAVEVSAEWGPGASGGIYGGEFLADLAQRSANGNGTGVDNAASSANGGTATLHVTQFAGLTNATIKVQHSSDNATFADLATFTVVSGVTSQFSEVAAGTAVNRYLRALWTVTGVGTITFAVAFARR